MKSKGIPRPLEALVAFVGLVAFAPIIGIAVLCVRLTSRGRALFLQERVGLGGKRFILLKLRTMYLRNDGPQITSGNDGRITPVGKLLRRSKVDELPALWNIFKGDMSFVGPRPEVPRYVDVEGNPIWRRVLQARPGVTDPVTLMLRNEEEILEAVKGDREAYYRDVLQPFKLKGYVDYLQKRNWRTDLKVLTDTVLAVVLPNKAPVPGFLDLKTNAPLQGADRSWSTGLIFSYIQFFIDLSTLASAFVFAYLLRFEFAIPLSEVRKGKRQIIFVVAMQLLALYLCGVQKFIWRYISMADLKAFIKAAVISAIPVVVLRVSLPDNLGAWRVPYSVITMDTIFVFGGLLMTRVLRRALYEYSEKRITSSAADQTGRKSVLLIGAGRAGVLAAKEIHGRGDSGLQIKGFIDDDARKQGTKIQGIRVVGTVNDLPHLVKEWEIDHVVITIAQASRQRIRRIVEVCEQIPVRVRIIPGLYEIIQGNIEISQIRDVRVEDLLGRESVKLEENTIRRFLAGKAVMVTGAGGSIGSELARQIARYEPRSLLLLERAEFALFNIHRDLASLFPDLTILPLVADVGDKVRIRSLFAEHSPDVLLHAAAHKHVPLMEWNSIEAVRNNVLATHNLGTVAAECGVEAFVLISTDKAVNPTSVMGASKRVAELVVQSLDDRFEDTRFVAVRFGNVIGSAGSVIPIFKDQIRKGGPVTVTHRDMKRYFMTIPEAAQLVLQAGSMGAGGEIFILDMGEPVSIMELARDTIIRSGLKPGEDIQIEITGLRPGEKLFEELQINGELMAKTRHQKIYIGTIAAYPENSVACALKNLETLVNSGDEQNLRRFLNDFLPEAQLTIADEKQSQSKLTATQTA